MILVVSVLDSTCTLITKSSTPVWCSTQHTMKLKLLLDIIDVELSSVILHTCNGVTYLYPRVIWHYLRILIWILSTSMRGTPKSIVRLDAYRCFMTTFRGWVVPRLGYESFWDLLPTSLTFGSIKFRGSRQMGLWT